MTDREALERIAHGDVGHEPWCGEGCDHAEEFARLHLAGKDPDAPRPVYEGPLRIVVKP